MILLTAIIRIFWYFILDPAPCVDTLWGTFEFGQLRLTIHGAASIGMSESLFISGLPQRAPSRLPTLLCRLMCVLLLILVVRQSNLEWWPHSARRAVGANEAVERLSFAIENKDESAAIDILNNTSQLELNRRDFDGLTPLLRAAQGEMVRCCRVLIEHGADVNLGSNQGVTPLACVVRLDGPKPLELINLLIQSGADIDAVDATGNTPLMTAVQMRRPDTIRRLIDAGADVNAAAANGWTALHWAYHCYDQQTIQALLVAGADPDARDDEGKRPAEVAFDSSLR